jgi:diadenosine tetraphosphatase ApaH/serine/threonine PP2A family protein phosphatase
VAGNHELLVSGRLSANGFSRSAADSHAAEDSGLSDKVRKAFADLPLTATADDAFVCHGSPTDTCEYLDSPASVRNALETTGGYGWLFAGHTHVPAVWDGHRLLRPRKEEESFRFEGSGPFFLNPGSVGQPRDGRTGASYCLWNDTARTALFRCVPVDKIRNRKKARKNDE